LQLQLIAIWEEVLGVRGIGIRDDFFLLGGSSLLAMRMLQRAETACGKVILPAALFRAPTIEHLAGEIAREAIDESPSLLRVHDAGTRTPFFYLHGDLSGGGFYSLKLSRALGPDQPFYVLPPQDIRLLSAAPSIEEMAAAHLEALRAVRPKGPYVIGGFCIGGVVAYELAQQIRAAGHTVELLLIIDSSLDRTLRALRGVAGTLGALFRWDGKAKVAHFGRWAVWRARLALQFAPNGRAETRGSSRWMPHHLFSGTLGFLGRRLRFARPAAQPAATDSPAQVERDLPSAFQWASASYRPQPYDGPVALLLSEDVLGRADNVSRAWQQLASDVTVQPLKGSHLECITEHVEALAEKIEHCLEMVIQDRNQAP
jgi:thioesterase domain-containing protein